MKTDVEIPEKVPTKRRQLEAAPAVWLAIWAEDEDLPPSARKRAQAERDRRKRENPDPVHLGLLIGPEGATPAQLAFIYERAHEAGVEKVFSSMRALKLDLAPGVYVPFLHTGRLHTIVRQSTHLIACPKDPEKPNVVTGVWEAARYAKHRSLPVRIVMPDGTERT